MVAGLDERLLLLVVLGVGLGVLDHAVDVRLGQAARRGDADGLLLAAAGVLGRDVDDAVGVDVKGDLDLRHAARRGQDAGELEAAKRHVVAGHGAFALEHVDGHRGLAVGRSGEDLALAGGDGGVAFDELGEHAAHGLDAKGKRADVEQQHVLHVTGQDAALDGRAHGHDLVRVDRAVGLLAEEFADLLLHQGHAGHAAHQHHFVDVLGGEAGVGERLLAGADGAFDQVHDQAFQLGAGDLDHQVLGAVLVGGDEGQVDLGLHGRGELLLGLLGGFLQALQGHAVLGQVDAVVALELFHQELDDALVEVFAAKERVAVGGAHFHDVVADFEDGDVKGAAAQVEHGDLLVLLAVHAVGQGGCGGLVDDALDLKAGDLARVLGGLALGVVEVGRNGDDGLGDGFAQIGLGVLLELLQDEGGNLGRAVFFAGDLDPGVVVLASNDLVGAVLAPLLDLRGVVLAAHEALDGGDGLLRVGHALSLGDLADEALLVREGHDGRGGAAALGAGDALGVFAFHDVDAGVGGPKVDADDLAHDINLQGWGMMFALRLLVSPVSPM